MFYLLLSQFQQICVCQLHFVAQSSVALQLSNDVSKHFELSVVKKKSSEFGDHQNEEMSLILMFEEELKSPCSEAENIIFCNLFFQCPSLHWTFGDIQTVEGSWSFLGIRSAETHPCGALPVCCQSWVRLQCPSLPLPQNVDKHIMHKNGEKKYFIVCFSSLKKHSVTITVLAT